MVYSNISDLIGKTPLMEAKKFNKAYGLQAVLLVKLELFNPSGSVKDRAAMAMIKDGIDRGLLKEGATIVEPTSGNTGIGLAAVAANMGFKVVLTMPETMSVERRNLLKAYGAQIVLTDGSKGMKGAIDKAEELLREIPGSYMPGQFTNMANVQAHRETTGPEIWEDTEGNIDIFVAGVGTGGTITGTGEFLKSKNPSIKVVAVEPSASPILSGGTAGPHAIQGIGANFIPPILNTDILDEIITVDKDEAFACAKAFASCEGLLVGISSGAALAAAVALAKREENRGKTIVALLPDTGERYLSTGLYD